MNLRQNKHTAKPSNWQASALATAAACAAAAALWGTPVARGDVLVTSFESGGFDYAGEATQTWPASSGVTNGTKSLEVDLPTGSWWNNMGYITINGADLAANTVLQFDILTDTGVNFIPIFHGDPNLPTDPGSGSYNQYTSGVGVSSSASVQTFTFNYMTATYGDGTQTGLPTASNWTLQLQTSNNTHEHFFIDNVRLTGAIPVLDAAVGSWKLNGSGDWVSVANWNTTDPGPGLIPGAPGSQVTFDTFGGTITTPSQILVNVTQAVAAMNVTFDKGGGGYKIAGNFTLSVSANIFVNSGNHEIANGLAMSSGSIIDVAANSSLLADTFSVTGYGGLTKNGAGTFTADKIQYCSLNVTAGTVAFKPGNAQNNTFIFGLNLSDGAALLMNGAALKTNALYGTGGTVDLGSGGMLSTALYSTADYGGVITGAGKVVVGDATETNDTSVSTATFSGNNTYTGGTRVSNGKVLVINPTGNIGTGSLTVDAVSVVPDGGGGFVPAQVNVVAGRTAALKVAALDLANTGTIDLNDNDLVVGSATPMSTIEGYVRNARHSGAWDQPGLTSSTAKANAAHNTNLGVISGADYTSFGHTGTFSGQTYAAGDTLVKYTWNGDTNFSGTVNLDDYVRVDIGFNTHLTGWSNGDFNYSGSVNLDDYILIDIAFNTQSGTLGRAVNYLSGDDRSNVGLSDPAVAKVLEHFGDFGATYGTAFLAAVPEPTMLGVGGLIASAAALRRRRRF